MRTGWLAMASTSLPFTAAAAPGAAARSPKCPFQAESQPSGLGGPELHPPPLAAALTKHRSRTAVLVRPPLPSARGGSRVLSQHPRWLRSQGPAATGTQILHG